DCAHGQPIENERNANDDPMNVRQATSNSRRTSPASRSGSVLVIVLWVTLGLISITVYFAGQMSLELHAADNRLSGLAAEQAISGTSRYLASVLSQQINLGSNGTVPDPSTYGCEAIRVGEAHYWLIGRDPNHTQPADRLTFGLVDEASRLNLN